MTVLITADLHFSENPRDAYRLEWFRRMREFVKENKIAHVLVLGDLTDEKDRHGAWLVNTIVDELNALAFLCPVTILKGNHDYVDADNPFFEFLRKIVNVEYISKPTTHTNLIGTLGKVLLLPHTHNHKKDWTGQIFDADLILVHNTFEGADVGHGRKLSGIPLSRFPKDATVISGDVHVPQKLGPVTYVGAPYTIDFGDDYEPRVLLLDKDKFKSYQILSPMKRLVEMQRFGETPFRIDADHIHDGDIVKVRVNLNSKEYQDWPKIKDEVYKWGESANVTIHMVQTIVAQAAVNQRRRDNSAQTDEELLAEYGKHRGIDAATMRTGKIIMEEV